MHNNTCEVCQKNFQSKRSGAKTCGTACRTEKSRMDDRIRSQLVLSLFPGADLLGRAFENLGFTVVRGPDVLWGGDVRKFHVPAGKFDGIIGGPPCQLFSSAALTGTKAENLIPEFLRLIEEAKPQWAVMENVKGVVDEKAGPNWPYTLIRDFDCGGLTNRIRAFWFHGIAPCLEPLPRRGEAEHTVLASSWKKRSTDNFPGHEYLQAEDAEYFQGFPGLGQAIMNAQPSYGGKSGLSRSSRNILAVHMLGNGVPRAMGEYIAEHVKRQVLRRDQWERTDLPPYPMFMMKQA